jgi:hypothetical protein
MLPEGSRAIALSGVPANVKCVEASDHVIEENSISTPDSRIWDLSPMSLGAAKTAMEIGEIAGIDAVKRVSQRTP